jgi:hypothetical protein
MSGVIVVELDVKTSKVSPVLLIHAQYQLFRTYACGTGADHNRSAVRIVRTEIEALVAAHLLEADPDIGL